MYNKVSCFPNSRHFWTTKPLADLDIDDEILGYTHTGHNGVVDALMDKFVRVSEEGHASDSWLDYLKDVIVDGFLTEETCFTLMLVGVRYIHLLNASPKTEGIGYKRYGREQTCAIGAGGHDVIQYLKNYPDDPLRAMLNSFITNPVSGGQIHIYQVNEQEEEEPGLKRLPVSKKFALVDIGQYGEVPKNRIVPHIDAVLKNTGLNKLIPTYIPTPYIDDMIEGGVFDHAVMERLKAILKENALEAVEEDEAADESEVREGAVKPAKRVAKRAAKRARSTPTKQVSTQELATLLGVSARTIRNELTRNGHYRNMVPVKARGKLWWTVNQEQ